MIRKGHFDLDRRIVPPGTRVLCVDDECTVGDVVVQILGSQFDCEVEAVCDGEAALDRIQERRFDVIIVDFLMPNMDGGELYELIASRRPELLPHILFMTGDTLTESTLEFIRATGQVLLEKPFGLPELARAVSRVMKRSRDGDRGRDGDVPDARVSSRVPEDSGGP
jgi:CheY-like chemotaxis protein